MKAKQACSGQSLTLTLDDNFYLLPHFFHGLHLLQCVHEDIVAAINLHCRIIVCNCRDSINFCGPYALWLHVHFTPLPPPHPLHVHKVTYICTWLYDDCINICKLFRFPFFFLFLSNLSDLTLHKGEIITLLKQVDENWYEGLCNGCQGFLPANYVEVQYVIIICVHLVWLTFKVHLQVAWS